MHGRVPSYHLLLVALIFAASCSGEKESPVAPPPPPPPPEEPNELPTAGFTIDVDLGQAPLEVNFDAASSSDPDGTLVSYSWEFGDGTTATGVTRARGLRGIPRRG